MREIIQEIINQEFIKIIISNPKRKENEYRKIIIRKLNNEKYQFEKYTQKQVFHENTDKDKCIEMFTLCMEDFRQCDAFTTKATYQLKVSKKGKLFISKKACEMCNVKVNASHNKEKQYCIPSGTFIAPLYDLGVFTKDGKVVQSMYDKYKQINRFIEMIDDCIKDDMTSLNIVDFGCGKSYLTFILYYYLVEIKKINVHMVGLDLKEDVIKNCNEIAKKYNYENLKFEVGDINGYHSDIDIDMVITLHACDTATDYALYNAICWNAKMIYSVPCCQHELNAQLKSDHFPLLTRYGLLKERFAAMLTDEIRANLLRSESYKVQVMEFIDFAHSPKNVLLRCVKSDAIQEKTKKIALEEVEQVMKEFHVEPTLYRLLKSRKCEKTVV